MNNANLWQILSHIHSPSKWFMISILLIYLFMELMEKVTLTPKEGFDSAQEENHF